MISLKNKYQLPIDEDLIPKLSACLCYYSSKLLSVHVRKRSQCAIITICMSTRLEFVAFLMLYKVPEMYAFQGL